MFEETQSFAKQLGKLGELAAQQFLENYGYDVINYNKKNDLYPGIDLKAVKENDSGDFSVLFVQVKATSSTSKKDFLVSGEQITSMVETGNELVSLEIARQMPYDPTEIKWVLIVICFELEQLFLFKSDYVERFNNRSNAIIKLSNAYAFRKIDDESMDSYSRLLIKHKRPPKVKLPQLF